MRKRKKEGGVKCLNEGSVDDLSDEENEKKKRSRAKMRRRGRGGGKKEGEGGWRKPSSYDTIDFPSEA